jgi:aryl-alcohol dehydrogenase-like predicted oxidoreductase/predicted kinase
MTAFGQPLGIGCMRLSTEADRDDARALATLHAALDAGVTLLDTADAYAWDEGDAGHNERLIARAVATWSGDAAGVRVATKGGLTRPGGRWLANGRARHLEAACEASRRALGLERIHLYQLHAPDPATSLATSVRALASLQKDGLIQHIGLCNVSLGQLEEARGIAEIAAVQVEISPWHEDSLRNGVAELCAAEGIALLAHRPLGGAAGARRLARDPVLAAVAERVGASPAEVALAWLRSLSPVLVPLPGPTRPEHARSAARAAALSLSEEDRAEIDRRFPAGRLLRAPRAARRPRGDDAAEVVLVIGLPGAGKSTIAAELVDQDYHRLNRDETGGRLADLIPSLDRLLAAGHRRIVLDNTYGSRAARNAVIEAAWAHGAAVRCVWLQTGLEDAQVNVARRIVQRYGGLLEPDALKKAARKDPGALAPQALYRHRREFEAPAESEGFARIDVVPFARQRPDEFRNRALILWFDSLTDAALLASRRDVVRRHADDGWLVVGLSWQPGIAGGTVTPADVEADLARAREILGTTMDWAYCPHGGGPPLPGLGVLMIERHRLDPARCVYVGGEAGDQAFARALGFVHRSPHEVFA